MHYSRLRARARWARAALFSTLALAALACGSAALASLSGAAPRPDEQGAAGTQADFVRLVPLAANDVVYNPADQTLYASVPSSAGAAGNSIAPINPATGAIGTPVFIGSEPTKLALSDDGHTLYASLEGAFAVRRFDTQTRTAGIKFFLGSDFLGLFSVNDLAVAPGNPNVVAVVRYFLGVSPPEAGVAIFDNGVQRPKTGVGHIDGSDYVAYSATESKLYGGGNFGGLRTMTIDATGVAATTTAAQSVGARIKLDGGLIYGSAGKVMNPETGALLGTFPNASSLAFVPDSKVGRVFYLSRDFGSAALTLRAYDINTFVLVGSTTLGGVAGDPTTLVRWGSNGLAFRTTSNQLYLVQTSLIPSADPIPAPTPTPAATPTPTPPAAFVRQLALPNNDLIYNPQNQLLYASVPSSAGAPRGNSVTRIDPAAGEIGASTFVGSEPNRLALTDDNQTMYVGLNGAGAVRRFDASSQTAGLQFSLGASSFDGPFRAGDIAVMPGSPGTVAVGLLGSSGGTTVYDDGVARAQKATAVGEIEFGSASRLYVGTGSVTVFSVAAAGLTQVKSVITGGSGTMRFAGGLLYFSNGVVVDPEAGEIKGRFANVSSSDGAMTVDLAQGRAYFLTRDFSSSSQWLLRSYELDTFRPIASVNITILDSSGFPSGPTSLVRWGKNGLAFRTAGRVYLVQSALVDTADAIPAPTPTPAATPTPSPTVVPTLVRKVDLAANDLVLNPADQKLYASVPGAAGAQGNSITQIDPATAEIGASTFVGSEPDRLAIADDGSTLYVNLDGAKAVRRFDIQTRTPGQQFAVGADLPLDMKVLPGSPGALAVSRGSTFNSGVAIFDNGVQRPSASSGGAFSIGPIEFGASAATLYGSNNLDSGADFVRFAVDASGVKGTATTRGLSMGNSMRFAGGRLYGASGRVIDPEAMTQLGTFNLGSPFGSLVAVDSGLGRVFFLSGGSGSGVVLSAYDINTFVPLGSVTLPGITGTPRGLVRWGPNGLAFCTFKPQFDTGATSQVYLVQSALVSDAVPIPSAVQFSAAAYSAFESASASNSVTVTVTRTGGTAGTVSVNYATGGGTATPGADYTPASGTLTFGPGETQKTFTVAILDDNVFEGNETVGLTLSAPTGALLGALPTATLTIQDNESRPVVTPVSFSVPEGDAGTTPAEMTVRLSNASVQTVTVNYRTTDGTATAGADYVAASGTLTYAPGETTKTIPLQIIGDKLDEGNENFFVDFSGATNADAFQRATVTIVDDERPTVQFASATFAAGEGDGRAQITVTRFGNADAAASVNYSTVDDQRSVRCDDNVNSRGAAFARCDYATVVGTLAFAPGEKEKTFTIPLIDDGYAEPAEFVQLRLDTPVGATLGTPSVATLTITDNDPTDQPNPLDTTGFFVRMQYLDFLSREPEAGEPWSGVVNNCPAGDTTCDRVQVSSAFFRSQEFQLKGLFVFKFYKAAFNRLPSYAEMVNDMSAVTGSTTAEVNARKAAFTDAFAQRPEFKNLFGSLSNGAFVDTLLNRYALQQITTTDPASPDGDAKLTLTRADLAGRLDGATLTRAQVVRAVASSDEVSRAEFNPAFVAMQYYGYLRRTPESGGFQSWLTFLNANPADFHAMVSGFVNSTEYRLRFGRP